MISNWLAGKTLAFRLTLFVFIGEAIVLTLFSVLIFSSSRSEMIRAFDNSVRAKAESIAALVEVEDEDEEDKDDSDDEEGVEFELNNDILPGSQYLQNSQPDEFKVTVDGQVLASSGSTVIFPMDGPDHSDQDSFTFQSDDGTNFRGVILVQFRPTESVIHTVRVGYAADMNPVNTAIGSIAQKIMIGTIFCLIISAWIVLYLARLTLEPVRDLTKQIQLIGKEFRGRRLKPDNLSVDLVPISNSVNSMIVEIEHAFEREKEFSSDAAHELRSPIASLKSSLQTSLLSLSNDETSDIKHSEVKEILESLLEDTERMEKLCEALLLLTVERGDDHRTSLSVSAWKHEILTAVECMKGLPSAEHANFSITDEMENLNHLTLNIDSSSVFRIVENLLDNALRHGGSKVSIRVTVKLIESTLAVVIEDNGPGIPEKHQAKIFDRFYRIDSSRNRNTGGTGLGLSICQTLAKNHGGEIQFESPSSGGCRFTWLIPVINEPDESEQHGVSVSGAAIQTSVRN